jgi:hypothetical protein
MDVTSLPCGVQDFLARCPRTGEGVNHWIFCAARTLHRVNVLESEMPAIIREATRNCGRVVSAQEIERAILNSGSSLKNGFQAERRTPRWPATNQEQIQAVVRDGPTLNDLKQRSPVKWNNGNPHTEEVIDILFPGNPLLCVGLTNCNFDTRLRESWRGRLSRRQFIVPSPMTKDVGMTKDGKRSRHTLDNTGPRRFLVTEFDKGTFDEQAAILAHLGNYAPLAMIVYSGSKSLHGWFFVQVQPDSKIESLFLYAVSLGADRATWTRSQFVRLPDGQRNNGKRQEVIYFNPQTVRGN